MREYPNVWPEGGIFAFSGFDGDVDWDCQFIARGLYKRVGWRFRLRPGLMLAPSLAGRSCRPLQGDKDYFYSDCWRAAVRSGEAQGLVLGAFVDSTSLAMRIHFPDASGDAVPEFLCNAEGVTADGAMVYSGKGWYVAVDGGAPEVDRRFGIAVSPHSAEEAVARARAARAADLKSVVNERLDYHIDAPMPEGFVGALKRLYLKSVSIQKANVVSPCKGLAMRWATADRWHDPVASVWDSVFQAMGLRHVRGDVAESALQAVMSRQGPNGKIAARLAPDDAIDDSDPVHPPLLAWAAWHVFDASGRGEFLQQCYEPLTKYLAWYDANRRTPDGLYAWRLRKGDDQQRGVEAAMENSPRFEGQDAVKAVDLASYLAGECVYMEKIARALNRTVDAQAWQERHRSLVKKINETHWDEFDRFYYDVDTSGDFVTAKTVAGLLPLHGRVADRDQVEGLRLHLTSSQEFMPYVGVASVSKDEAAFGLDMWRGPMWLPMNLLIHYGLMSYGFVEDGRALANMSIQEANRCFKDHGCIYEYYDPQGNEKPYMLPRLGKARDEKGSGSGVREDHAAAAGALLDLMRQVG